MHVLRFTDFLDTLERRDAVPSVSFIQWCADNGVPEVKVEDVARYIVDSLRPHKTQRENGALHSIRGEMGVQSQAYQRYRDALRSGEVPEVVVCRPLDFSRACDRAYALSRYRRQGRRAGIQVEGADVLDRFDWEAYNRTRQRRRVRLVRRPG